jgi:hypothetical protein
MSFPTTSHLILWWSPLTWPSSLTLGRGGVSLAEDQKVRHYSFPTSFYESHLTREPPNAPLENWQAWARMDIRKLIPVQRSTSQMGLIQRPEEVAKGSPVAEFCLYKQSTLLRNWVGTIHRPDISSNKVWHHCPIQQEVQNLLGIAHPAKTATTLNTRRKNGQIDQEPRLPSLEASGQGVTQREKWDSISGGTAATYKLIDVSLNFKL